MLLYQGIKNFLGSDSAPHLVGDKQSDCGCAGVYNAHKLIDILAEFFDFNKVYLILKNLLAQTVQISIMFLIIKKTIFEKNKSLIPILLVMMT